VRPRRAMVQSPFRMQPSAGKGNAASRKTGTPAFAVLVLSLAPIPAFAQDMPAGHETAMSAPLFVPDLAVGTISVRLARPSLTDSLVGVEVAGSWTLPDGKQSGAKVKTGDDGRAMFTQVPAGAIFSARAEVEGEALATPEFPVPSEGGTRLLLIVGANADDTMAEMTGASPHGSPHGMGGGHKTPAVRAGNVAPSDELPAGTVEIRVVSAEGKPLPGVRVDLAGGRAGASGVEVKHAETDPSGTARFVELGGSAGGHWAAVVERNGLRLGSALFTLEAKRGAAGELRMPGRTSELSALRVSASTRMMVELREDSIAFLQNLVVENTSDKVFDPGPRGLLVPLPDGCTGAEKMSGGAEVELKEGSGAILHGLLPPKKDPATAAQIRVGCVISTHATPEVEIVQPMPLGMEGGLVMIPATLAVGVSAPGIRPRPVERDDNGNELRMYDLDRLPAGQPLRLVVYGLPTRGQAGKWIAGILAALLVVGGVVAARRRRPETPAAEG
jgi:hypothetical protein